MDNKCTILVNSCDAYEDSWYPFFKLFNKYWKDCPYQIVLNTEYKNFNMNGISIKTYSLDASKKMKWGERLIKTLKKINTKYIIFMLDDFFLMDYVENEKIFNIIKWMDEDSDIGVFSFNTVDDEIHADFDDGKYEGYVLRNKKGNYRYNCQAAIWRRDFLIKCLRKYESPWDWELIGNRRSRFTNKKFYTVKSKDKMIFKYDYQKVGIIRGKWGLPDTKVFLDSEDINIDYSIRNSKCIEEKENSTNRCKLYWKKIRSLW